MQRVAAEMKHSETAFVRAARRRRRSTCAGSRPRSRSTSAGTRRSRARTCSGRRAGSRPTPTATFHTRSGELTRAHAAPTARSQLDFPAAPPEPCDRPAGAARRARRRERRGVLRTDGEFFMLRRRRRRRPCATLAPDFARARARSTDVRGVYVTARGRRRRYDIVSRCFAPAGRHRRGPGHRFDALRARRRTGARGSARRAARRTRRRRAAASCTCAVAGDRALLAGHAVTVLARRATRVAWRCHASCASPSRSRTRRCPRRAAMLARGDDVGPRQRRAVDRRRRCGTSRRPARLRLDRRPARRRARRRARSAR